MFYISLVFFMTAYFLNEKYELEIPKGYLVLPFLIINFIKYGAGTDYFSYSKIFDNLSSGSFLSALNSTSKVEIGYRFSNILASRLGMNFIVFSALFMSVISYYALKWIFEDSKNPYLSVLLFFTMFYLYWNLSALRHGLVLVTLTYIYFSRRNEFSGTTKFIMTVVMFTFHKAALIVPVFYLISKLKWKRLHFIILLLLAPISRIITLEPVVSKMAQIPVISKFFRYLDYNSIRYLSIPSFQRLFFIMLILLFYNKLIMNKSIRLIVNYALANLIIYFYLPTAMVIGTRITIFGYYTMIIIIPEIVSLVEKKNLKIVAFAGVNLMSVVFLFNELDKQKSNSMYIHSIHRMNFETIFNKNLDHYANAYALDYQVEIANIELENTSEIYLKMIDSQTIVPVDNDATYLSVKFPEKEDYGIIDKNGNIVLQPILKNRVNTYGPYYRVHNDELFVKNYSYYRIDEPLYPVEYDLVSPYVNDLFEINNTLNGQRIIGGFVDIDIIDSYSFLDRYNLDSVLTAEQYYYEDNEAYSYVRLATKYSSYYIFLYEDNPVVEKLYKRITPLNDKGILTGYSHSGVDYINDNNDLFWYETR